MYDRRNSTSTTKHPISPLLSFAAVVVVVVAVAVGMLRQEGRIH